MSNNSARFAKVDSEHAKDAQGSLSETQKSLLGLPYLASEPALVRARLRARRLFLKYNQTAPNSYDPPDLQEGQSLLAGGSVASAAGEGAADVPGVNTEERRLILKELFGLSEEQSKIVEIEPPFFCDYGNNIKLEGAFYANFNTVILDCAEVTIGNGVLFGPNVSIYGGTHTVSLPERQAGLERALPVSIGADTWVGGGVIIQAGVNIGKACTIGAGSIVTRDIPDFSVAVGSPAKVVKTLQGEERGSWQ